MPDSEEKKKPKAKAAKVKASGRRDGGDAHRGGRTSGVRRSTGGAC